MAQGEGTELGVIPGGKEDGFSDAAVVTVKHEHYAAAERLAQLVEDLLPDQTRQKRIDMSSALLDFYKTR